MIVIDDDYFIEVDFMNYAVMIDRHKVSIDKSGKERPVYDNVGYFSSLDKAIKGILEDKTRKSLSEGKKSLETALKCVVDTYKQFDSLLEKAVNQWQEK